MSATYFTVIIRPAMKSLPKILYKYCDRWGVDILQHHRLKVTPFDKFNDPFELAPRMRPDFPVDDARTAIMETDFQRALYDRTFEQRQFSGSFEEFVNLLRIVKDDLAAKLAADYPKDAADFRMNHLPTISKEFGLICLSSVPDDILMWSHYTNGHTGFVIGFDTTNEFFANPPAREVEYKEERVLMGHYSDRRDQRSVLVDSLIRRKSIHWSYEHEWRQLHQLGSCVSQADTNPQRPNEFIYYKPVSPAAICEIIAGSRCDSSKIEQLLNRAELAHLKPRRARIHETDFKLVFDG